MRFTATTALLVANIFRSLLPPPLTWSTWSTRLSLLPQCSHLPPRNMMTRIRHLRAYSFIYAAHFERVRSVRTRPFFFVTNWS